MVDIADPDIGPQEWEAVEAVLESGHLAAGEQVEQFEDEFAAFCEADRAVATSNGTTALHATLEALELPAGTKVITTPFTFIATANTIRLAGLEPVFVDVDPDTFTINPAAVEAALERHDDVGAIMAVHLYGLPADMASLRSIANDYGVYLIEDAAQAHDARVDGRPVGFYGDAATFSFYPTKNMTTGEGGMVITDDPDIEARVREFINHGRTASGSTYEHARVGHNFRLTDMAAAIGRVQLGKLPEYTAARRENALRYDELLADANVRTPVEPPDRRHVYHQYTVLSEARDELVDHLADHDVGAAVYYPTPVHEQRPYHDHDVELPVAERLADRVVSLPVHPKVGREGLEQVAEAIAAFEGVRA